jgi:hypothetical protein
MRWMIPRIGLLVLAASWPAAAQDWQDAPGDPAAEPAPAAEQPPVDEPAVGPVPAGAAPPKGLPQRINIEPPPPPARVPRRGYRTHDGFYLRLGIGAGYVSSNVSYEESAIPDRTLHGGAFAFDVMIGGSPARGLALGGGLWLMSAPEPKVDAPTSEEYEDLGFDLVGFFVDGFPDPTAGFHVGGAVGIAALNATFADDAYDVEPDRIGDEQGGTLGVGAAAWIGYDAWIAPEWSLGGMVRFSGAITSSNRDELEQRAGSRGLAILFTALHH